jgi:hypothetical protein
MRRTQVLRYENMRRTVAGSAGLQACAAKTLMANRYAVLAILLGALITARDGWSQAITQRGFVEARGTLFPLEAPNDPTRAVADLLAREEVFVKPAPWLRFAAGADLRANSHDQVDDCWGVDFTDRGRLRPRVSIRRATATISRGPFTIDLGKQFIRWGKADIVNPTDRFAPRDFLNVVETEFLAVTGARAVAQAGGQNTLEIVWVPRLTPSRVPLLNQRWTPVPPDLQIPLVDAGAVFPIGAQTGVRWSRIGTRIEHSLTFFDGFNHLPNVDVRVGPLPVLEVSNVYPSIRSYGADAAMPTPWFTVKGEMAYVTSTSPGTDEYVLYVVQVERQTGEWVFVGGYAGEVVTERRAGLAFAPDRGLTKSLVGRAAYTIGPNRSVAFETAIRQNLHGVYGRAEYSQAHGQHWRLTIAGVLIGGEADDFLGQYRRNSHGSLVLRYSF